MRGARLYWSIFGLNILLRSNFVTVISFLHVQLSEVFFVHSRPTCELGGMISSTRCHAIETSAVYSVTKIHAHVIVVAPLLLASFCMLVCDEGHFWALRAHIIRFTY